MMEKYPYKDRFCNTLSALYQALKGKKKVFFSHSIFFSKILYQMTFIHCHQVVSLSWPG